MADARRSQRPRGQTPASSGSDPVLKLPRFSTEPPARHPLDVREIAVAEDVAITGCFEQAPHRRALIVAVLDQQPAARNEVFARALDQAPDQRQAVGAAIERFARLE